MRSGQNPAKFVDKVATPERITVAVVTYLPFLAGYYAEGLRVLALCLDSLRRNTAEAFDLLVFDNGSAPEVVADLEARYARGQINILILMDRNIGKGGAWDFILPAAPGEIVAYADGDVYFRPGWLTKSLAILEGYPNVGMVSSRPLRTRADLAGSTLKWAAENREVLVERGSFVSWEDFREHDVGLGQAEAEVLERYRATEDTRLTWNGLPALVGAVHWQFVAHADVLRKVLPLSLDRPMGQVRTLDERLDRAGYLRLMTPEPLVRHLGNTVPDDLTVEHPGALAPQERRQNRVLDWKPVRRALLALHDRIFRWYFRR